MAIIKADTPQTAAELQAAGGTSVWSDINEFNKDIAESPRFADYGGIIGRGSTAQSGALGMPTDTLTGVLATSLQEDSETGEVTATPVGNAGKMGKKAFLISTLYALGANVDGMGSGVTIDELIANIDQDWYANQYLPYIDSKFPGDIPVIADTGTGKNYVREDVLNDLKNFLRDSGVFSSSTDVDMASVTLSNSVAAPESSALYTFKGSESSKISITDFDNYLNDWWANLEISNAFTNWKYQGWKPAPSDIIAWCNSHGNSISALGDNDLVVFGCSDTGVVNLAIYRDFFIDTHTRFFTGNGPIGTVLQAPSISPTSTSSAAYGISMSRWVTSNYTKAPNEFILFYSPTEIYTFTNYQANFIFAAWNVGSIETYYGIAGIGIQPGAQLPSADDIAQDFFDWNDAKRRWGIIDDQGNIVDADFFPIDPFVEGVDDYDQEGAQSGDITLGKLKKILDDMIDDNPIVPTSPSTDPQGTTPGLATPVDFGDIGLLNYYTPTEAQVKSFNSFLWSASFVDVVKQLLQNPFDAVISLHRMYLTIPSQTTGEIVIGKIGSGVFSAIPSSQHYILNCGSIDVLETANNASDYSGYTEAQLYLPFIGFVKLNPSEVINSRITVEYTIDIITGDCVAAVMVMKRGEERTNVWHRLYSFAGNCVERVPVTGMNYTALLATGASAIATTAVGAVAGGVAGGIAGGVAGAINVASKLGDTMQRSGSLSGNAGVLGPRKPYILLTKKAMVYPDDYQELEGFPARARARLGTLSGFTRVTDVDLDDFAASAEEKRLLEDLLKEGVYL